MQWLETTQTTDGGSMGRTTCLVLRDQPIKCQTSLWTSSMTSTLAANTITGKDRLSLNTKLKGFSLEMSLLALPQHTLALVNTLICSCWKSPKLSPRSFWSSRWPKPFLSWKTFSVTHSSYRSSQTPRVAITFALWFYFALPFCISDLVWFCPNCMIYSKNDDSTNKRFYNHLVSHI